jgi:hypothetical protein
VRSHGVRLDAWAGWLLGRPTGGSAAWRVGCLAGRLVAGHARRRPRRAGSRVAGVALANAGPAEPVVAWPASPLYTPAGPDRYDRGSVIV